MGLGLITCKGEIPEKRAVLPTDTQHITDSIVGIKLYDYEGFPEFHVQQLVILGCLLIDVFRCHRSVRMLAVYSCL